MNNCVKNVALVSVGAVGGFTACGALIINKILESDDCREFIARKISDKIETALFGKSLKSKEYSNRDIVTEAICFNTRNEADKILKHMIKIADYYGVITVSEFRDLTEMPTSYLDVTYGWTYEQVKDAEVVPFGSAFAIKIQKPKKL